jgi:hypothetical protein
MPLPVFPPFILVSLVVFACCLISAGIGILLTRAKFKKKKFIKARIIIILSFAGIITLCFLFYTISNIVGRSSVRAMWEKVETAGLTTNPEEIIPKDPNYYLNDKTTYYDTRRLSDNAIPLYEAAIALIKNSGVSDKRFDIGWRNQGKNKNRNAMPLANVPIYDVPNWPSKDRIEALKLSKNKDVQQALVCFSRGNQKSYAVNLRYYTDIEANIQELLPRLNHYREIFRMISFVSECYALEGKLDEAYKLSLDGFKFIHQFRNDPFIISHLVYIACTWIDLRTLNALVSRYGISSQKAQKTIKILNRLDCNKSMQKGLHGNLILCTQALFKKRITGETNYARSFFGKRKAFADYVYLYPFNYQEYASYLDSWLKNYELYEKPYWQIKYQLEKLNKEKSQMLLMNNLANYLFSYRLKTARTNSLIAATKIILALHIYRNKHGKFPEKLDSLTPAILKKISVDPVNGKAFGYKKEGKYFKLSGFYSGGK